MKEEQFIKANSGVWKELEELYSFIDKKGIRTLPSIKVKQFLHLFRQTSHHLAYSRTHFPKSSLTAYLNSLVSKCHNHVYAVRKAAPEQLVGYMTHGFPGLLKEYRLYIIASFGFFLIGTLLSLIMVFVNTENASIFLPQYVVEGVKAQEAVGRQWNYPLMSSYIMVNNITVSLRAFVLGITLGLGTAYVLFMNGTILGALTALMYLYGNPAHYWSLILPHGVIELTAVFISGAAGLIIAKGILIPGDHSRGHALIYGAKRAVSLLGGIVFMLIIAGIIEGFFTPLEIPVWVKLTFAAVTAIALAVYFAVPYVGRPGKER